jgi:hypothetical protein
MSASILWQMLRQDRRAATVADTMQAERWREWLLHERSELAVKLSKHQNQCEHCGEVAVRRPLPRGTIRELERETRRIDYMIEGLARRFTDDMQTLRRA